MTGVLISPVAEGDLRDITDYIALDNPARADRFEDELLAHARAAAQSPLAYPARPELGRGVRSFLHGAYLAFFTVTGEGITILRILHGARFLTSDIINPPHDLES